MELHKILSKSKKKIILKDINFRKADISYEDRPYKEKKFVLNGRQTDDKQTTELIETENIISNPEGYLDTNYVVISKNINGRQTDDKQTTELIETENIISNPEGYLDTNYVVISKNINGRQTDDKQTTELIETENIISNPEGYLDTNYVVISKNINGRQTDDKQTTELTETENIISYLDHNLIKNNKLKSKILFGNEQKVWNFLKKNCIDGYNKTKPLTKKDIIKGADIFDSCLKKTLERLIKKNVLSIHISQTGKFGWRIFKVFNN